MRQELPDSPLVIGLEKRADSPLDIGLEKRGGVVDVSFELAAVVASEAGGTALEEASRRGDMPRPLRGRSELDRRVYRALRSCLCITHRAFSRGLGGQGNGTV